MQLTACMGCGRVALIQSLGATQWVGIKLPVMTGVTFASVAPLVAMAHINPGAANPEHATCLAEVRATTQPAGCAGPTRGQGHI